MIKSYTNIEKLFQFHSITTANVTTTGFDTNIVTKTNIVFPESNTYVVQDNADNLAQYPSLAIINGNPAIAYRNATQLDVRFSRCSTSDGSGLWSYVLVSNAGFLAQPGPVDGELVQLVEANGRPFAVFFNDSGAQFKGIYWNRANDANGTSWPSFVSNNLIVSASSASGTNVYQLNMSIIAGNPAIVYTRQFSTGDRILYVRSGNTSGTSWGTPITIYNPNGVISAEPRGERSSFLVVNSRPYVVYARRTPLSIWYIRGNDATGTTWSTGNTNFSGIQPSAAIVNGRPAFVYRDASDNIRFVRSNNVDGTSWPGSSIVVTTGRDATLSFVNGFPRVAVIDTANNSIKVAYSNSANGASGSWAVQTIDTIGTPVSSILPVSSIELDSNFAVAYRDNNNQSQKFFYGDFLNVDTTANYDLSYMAVQ